MSSVISAMRCWRRRTVGGCSEGGEVSTVRNCGRGQGKECDCRACGRQVKRKGAVVRCAMQQLGAACLPAQEPRCCGPHLEPARLGRQRRGHQQQHGGPQPLALRARLQRCSRGGSRRAVGPGCGADAVLAQPVRNARPAGLHGWGASAGGSAAGTQPAAMSGCSPIKCTPHLEEVLCRPLQRWDFGEDVAPQPLRHALYLLSHQPKRAAPLWLGRRRRRWSGLGMRRRRRCCCSGCRLSSARLAAGLHKVPPLLLRGHPLGGPAAGGCCRRRRCRC